MTSIEDILQQNEKPKKTLAEKLNISRNVFMGFAFLAMGALMVFPEKFKVESYIQFDAIQRYLFGGICLLYGSFRMYRVYEAIKN